MAREFERSHEHAVAEHDGEHARERGVCESPRAIEAAPVLAVDVVCQFPQLNDLQLIDVDVGRYPISDCFEGDPPNGPCLCVRYLTNYTYAWLPSRTLEYVMCILRAEPAIRS